MTDLFTICDFDNDNWRDRDRYRDEDSVDVERVLELHNDVGTCVSNGQFLLFCDMNGQFHFDVYLYQVVGWSVTEKASRLDPVIRMRGTTFDGIRECYGSHGFTCRPSVLASALIEVDEYLCKRFTGYKEWHE